MQLQKESVVTMPRTNEDTRMVNAAKTGDVEAMAWLYDKYRRRIYNLCLRMVRDQADAEDLTQDVFVQLFRKVDTFRGESAFSTWLHRLAVNMVLMEIRSRKSHVYAMVPIEAKSEDDDVFHEQFGREDIALRGSLDRVTLENALS